MKSTQCAALVFFLGTLSNQIFAETALQRHGLAETKENRKYVHLATGQLYGRLGRDSHAFDWPVKILSIGHTIASYQKYGLSEPYFHHGIDIRANDGSDILASRGGKVVNIENYIPGDPAYWEVAILDADGFIWQYHHINKNSIPLEIKEAYKSGQAIATGTKIGEVYKWSVKSFGEYFHHIHLNILGAGAVYHNPLLFLKRLQDQVAPIVKKVQVVTKKGIQSKARSDEPYTLIAHAEDLILHKQFKVPPYHTWISVDGSKPVTVWKFDSLPGGSSKTDYIHSFYMPQLTCGNYRCREFGINLGFYRGRQLSFPSQPGRHRAVIGVSDVYGNESRQTFEWMVE